AASSTSATPRRVVAVKRGDGTPSSAPGSRSAPPDRRPAPSRQPRNEREDDGMTYNPFADLLKGKR
ncbi:MAG TPA: hypothetical protein PKH81_03295, partial [Treponemataceae bacterium]|nr:hypothetical protein [Treponemataceae bacterium]